MSGPKKGVTASLLWDQFNLGRFMRDATWTAERDELDATAWSTAGTETTVPSYTKVSATLSGLFTGSTGSTGSDNFLSGEFGSTAPILTYGPEGTAVGSVAKLTKALHRQYEISNPVNDVVSFSAGVKGSTRFESGVFVKSLAANTSTGSGSAVDSGSTAGSASGGVAHLHVTAASTLTSFVAKVQHSSNSTGAWSDLITFTASTDVGVQRSTVSGTVKQHTRYTISTLTGGASKTVTSSIAFARHQ